MKASIQQKAAFHKRYLKNKIHVIYKSMIWSKEHPAKRNLIVRNWHERHPEISAFYNAKQRCENPNNPRFKYYGARGIKCYLNHWRTITSTIGKRPSKNHSLDRIDNNGHYKIGNIRWATLKQQQNNRRLNEPTI